MNDYDRIVENVLTDIGFIKKRSNLEEFIYSLPLCMELRFEGIYNKEPIEYTPEIKKLISFFEIEIRKPSKYATVFSFKVLDYISDECRDIFERVMNKYNIRFCFMEDLSHTKKLYIEIYTRDILKIGKQFFEELKDELKKFEDLKCNIYKTNQEQRVENLKSELGLVD